MNSIGKIKNDNILLLQGPVGYFFTKLSKEFEKNGANTFRIGLNKGDEFFSSKSNYTPYRGTPQDWQKFIYEYMKKNNINKIFLFGDCRFYQSIAIKVALSLEIKVFVFEEGYIRPDYITLERFGVNDNSHLCRNPDYFRQLEDKEIQQPQDTKTSSFNIWLSAIVYYFVANVFNHQYPHYIHHRNFSAFQEWIIGIKSLIKKPIYLYLDQKYIDSLKTNLSKKYFFIPLQTHNDYQILQHSKYSTLEKFIIEVLESYSKHCSKDISLVFKHHPIDRGRKNYTKFIKQQADILGIKANILIFHEIHLPTCLKNAIGTITINSTVGLSSIYHKTPTITLGNAIYNIEGLTNKNISLDEFWNNYKSPDMAIYRKYRNYIIEQTQLNGSFYGIMPNISFE
jgi:capsular polysaccharide export protein